MSRDLRRVQEGRSSTGTGLKEFERLFPAGSDVARRLAQADDRTAHDGAAYRTDRRASDARVLRSRTLVVVLLEASQRQSGSAVARGRALWFGRTATRRKDGMRIRPEQRQGLSSRLRCCAKTIQRLWRRLEDAGIGRAHQPQDRGGVAPEQLPEWMRGASYAYLVWRWTVAIPREAARARFGAAAHDYGPPAGSDPPGQRVRVPISSAGAAFASDLLASLDA